MMKSSARNLAIALLLVAGLPAAAQEAPEPAAAPGRLELTAALIARDLSIRPIPKQRFLLIPDDVAAADPVAEIVTGFDGTGVAVLRPGPYRIVSATAVEWDGRQLTWDVRFTVEPGAVVAVELSGDNAEAEQAPRAGKMTPEARLYQRFRPSVFLVASDSGMGTGFLVDPAGLLLTNHHVAGKSRFLSVLIAPGKKVPAALIAEDADHDIAVLRVHPDSVEELEPLPLIDGGPDGDGMVVGERVMAIGNPLSQQSVLTTGIVSKVEDDAIITDVAINPGNSGGPLIDLDGRVLGLNTFGLSAGGGPGIGGTVRIHVAARALEAARAKLPDDEPPAFDLLPTISETRYPLAELRARLTSEPDIKTYVFDAGQFEVTLFTPPFLHSTVMANELKAAEMQRKRQEKKRKKKERQQQQEQPEEPPAPDPAATYDPADEMFDWMKHAGAMDSVVFIRALPEIQMTGGSKAGRFFGALAGVVTPAKYRFKTDFREMQLWRDGELVRPIHPGRICESVNIEGYNQLHDIGCFGQYLYDPEDFRSGSNFELHLYNEDDPTTPTVETLSSQAIARIRKDFEPFYGGAEEAEEAP